MIGFVEAFLAGKDSDLKNGIIRIGVASIPRFFGSRFFQIIFFKNELTIDHRKWRRGQAGFVVEIRLFWNSAVSVVHADGCRYLFGTHHHGVSHNFRLHSVPFFIGTTDTKMIERVSRSWFGRLHKFPRFPIILGHPFVAHPKSAKETFLCKRNDGLISYCCCGTSFYTWPC